MALRPGDLAVRRRSSLAGVGRQARHVAGGSKPAAREAPAPLGRAAGKLVSVPGERRAGARRGRRSSPRLQAEGSGGERAEPQEVGAAMPWPRGGRGMARRGLPRLSQAHRAPAQRQQPPPRNPMSQPGVQPGPSRPVPAITPLLRAAAAATGGTAEPAAATAAAPSEEGSPAPPNTAAGCLSSRLLLFLGVLQICLGCTIVALDFGALSLGSSSQVKNACPFWAGSSIILCGILAVMLWKRPTMVLANLFVLLSLICVLLSVASFIVICQGIQFVSSVPRCDVVDMGQDKICFCCEKFHLAKCTEETALKLYRVTSCSEARLFLKKILFILCALNAFSTTVCLSAAALHSLEILAMRRTCMDEFQTEDQNDSDGLDFVPSVPPRAYFSTSYSHIPRMRRRTLGSDVIPLPHIYGVRVKGAEVFCPLDPPSYEDVLRENNSEQEGAPPVSAVQAGGSGEVGDSQASQGAELNCEAVAQAEVEQQLGTVALQSSLGSPLMGRHLPLVGKILYRDVERLVAWITEQSSRRMSPGLRELLQNIKPVLKTDERPEEASTSAAFLEQVTVPAQQAMSLNAHVLAFKRLSGLLQLESGDVTTDADELAEGRIGTADD